MTTYSLKRQFQVLLRPIAFFLIKRGVTPNQVTVFTVLLSVLYSISFVWLHFVGFDVRTFLYTVPFLFFVRMALNAIDGLMAVHGDMKTPLGVFLNEIGDVISDSVLYLAFGVFSFVHQPLLVAFVFLAILSELAGLVSVSIGAGRRYDGPMGKSDRAVLMGIGAVMIASGVESEAMYVWLLTTGVLALIWTVVNRVRRALKEAQDASTGSQARFGGVQ